VILTDAEVAALTRRERPKAQARVLRLLGIPFAVHPTDGNLLVSRAAAEAALGAPIATTVQLIPDNEYEVNTEAIRHQQAPKSGRR
jgi:hypothetical protein